MTILRAFLYDFQIQVKFFSDFHILPLQLPFSHSKSLYLCITFYNNQTTNLKPFSNT